MELKEKPQYKALLDNLRKFEKLAIAFSGGVDSSFLLAAAKEALGNRLTAYTVKTIYIPESEIQDAIAIANSIGVPHKIIHIPFPEIIRLNPPDRCYHCKTSLFKILFEEAQRDGIHFLAEGTNADDLKDIRPGMKALKELGVRSPLLEAGISKVEIRRMSQLLGLPTADKPALACLLTRIPYNTEIKKTDLDRIELAEQFLRTEGFEDVRVRTHGTIARIELPLEKLSLIIEKEYSARINQYFRNIGFEFITIDLEGYKKGGRNLTDNSDNYGS